jgi:MFS family permease
MVLVVRNPDPHIVGGEVLTETQEESRKPKTNQTTRPARTLTAKQQRRNFILGVLNGAFVQPANAFMDPNMVLSWFLAQLGVSNVLIGLVTPIRMGSSFLLQILVSGHLQRQPHKLPFYRRFAALRCLLLLCIAAAVALIPQTSVWMVASFFAILVIYSLIAGLLALPFMDIVAKMIPSRRRGTFFAQRSFWGNILVLGASAVVGYILGEPGRLRFPANIAVLFVLASFFYGLTSLALSFIYEPTGETKSESVRWIDQIRRGFDILRTDTHYRLFLLTRLALIPADWAGPFYVVYARTALGISPRLVGFYIAARTVSAILSNLLWGRISDRQGNRKLIRIANWIGLMVPVTALGIGLLAARRTPVPSWLPYLYTLVFVAYGAFSTASIIGGMNYLLDIIPSAERSLYLGFNSTIFGIVRFSALASGLIVDWAGYRVLIVIGACFFALSLVLSYNLSESRAIPNTGKEIRVADGKVQP